MKFKAHLASARRYKGYCHERQLPSFPVTLSPVQRWLCSHVRSNKGSAKSLSSLIAALKHYSRLHRMPWLDEADTVTLRYLCQELHLLDQIPSNQKQPLTMALLYRMQRRLTSSTADLQTSTMLWMGHDGLLRIDEIIRDHRVMDITWDRGRRGFSLRLWRDKTHRQGHFLSIHFSLRPGPCAVRSLYLLFQRRNLWSNPEAILFPAMASSKSLSVSPAYLRLKIKQLVSAIGLNSKAFSAHSLRAGGATDLFVLRVPYGIIKKMGRWKSECFLLYYRDEEDVNQAVFQAFATLAKAA